MVKVPKHSGGAQLDLPGKRGRFLDRFWCLQLMFFSAGPPHTSDPRSELNLGGVNDTGEES